MKLWLVLTVIALSQAEPAAPPAPAAAPMPRLYPIGAPGTIEYIDSTGAVVLTARPGDAEGFGAGEALARVRQVTPGAEGFGFMDRSGRVVIAVTYDRAQPFREGLAAVRVGGKFGFVDESGRMAIEPRFEDVAPTGFEGGLAPVKISDGWGFIDRAGALVIPPRFKDAAKFTEDRAAVRLVDFYGFVDRPGRIVVSPRFSAVLPFSEGLAAVEENSRWHFIDPNGARAIRADFADARGFSEGLAMVVDESGGRPRFIDHGGKTVIAPNCRRAGDFHCGLASVQRDDGKWGWIDHTGKTAIPFAFSHVDDFSGGLARVSDADFALVGYLNPAGRWVWRRSSGARQQRSR